MTKIRFPIGDWSDDGHGKCDYFIASTHMTVQDVREAHFAAPRVLGFDIGDLCRDYCESSINDLTLDKIYEIYPEFEDIYAESFTTKTMFDLWIKLLNHIDPELNLRSQEEDIENINFYGYDDKGRHLRVPGYGLFQ